MIITRLVYSTDAGRPKKKNKARVLPVMVLRVFSAKLVDGKGVCVVQARSDDGIVKLAAELKKM